MGDACRGVSSVNCGIRIVGISSTVPKEKLELSSLSGLYGEKYIKKVSAVTGIYTVRVAPAGMTASDYCVDAAERLFRTVSYDRNSIDGLVFVSQSPDYIVPHTSAIMQHRLGLRNSIVACDVNYGCPGFAFGLCQAYSWLNAGVAKKVLLCCGDTMTGKINDNDKALRLVMGDGGSAVIIEKSVDAEIAFRFFTDGSGADRLIVKAGAARLPREQGMTDILTVDEDGNGRSLENLYMDGIEVMNFALKDVVGVVSNLVSDMRWSKEVVDCYIFHQANALIVKYLAKKLRVPVEKVPLGIADIGNTSSASIPIMLNRNYGNGSYVDFGKTVICGFGTGLSSVACAMNMNRVYMDALSEL